MDTHVETSLLVSPKELCMHACMLLSSAVEHKHSCFTHQQNEEYRTSGTTVENLRANSLVGYKILLLNHTQIKLKDMTVR